MFLDYDTGVYTVEELAGRYGISRETFYVWKRRRESGAEDWYEEFSRAPDRCPHATPEELVSSIIAMRRKFPRFGPKKILAKLASDRPEIAWPAASTIGDILKRQGMVTPRSARRRPLPQGNITPGADAPNDEWSIDFKGWFRTADGTRCDPLTIEDTVSRYLIETRITEPDTAGVKRIMERVFRENGLPDAIRSDNGSPFGSVGAAGLSRLSVWWLKLGIEPRYIPPSSPQDNGRHERMHRTLKAETSKPPAATPKEQQARFDAFRTHYNEERPHEALLQTPPAKHWQPSRRPFPKRIAEPWYDANHEVRRVRRNGGWIKWRGAVIFIGWALGDELIGLSEIDEGRHIVRFCGHDLGVIGRDLRFHPFAPPRARRRSAVETEKRTE
jgi:transposase InsO family protein